MKGKNRICKTIGPSSPSTQKLHGFSWPSKPGKGAAAFYVIGPWLAENETRSINLAPVCLPLKQSLHKSEIEILMVATR